MISLGVRRVASNLYLQNRYWLACSEPPLQQTANLQVALEQTLRTLTGLQTLMHEKCSQFPGQFLFCTFIFCLMESVLVLHALLQHPPKLSIPNMLLDLSQCSPPSPGTQTLCFITLSTVKGRLFFPL